MAGYGQDERMARKTIHILQRDYTLQILRLLNPKSERAKWLSKPEYCGSQRNKSKGSQWMEGVRTLVL
jgi:hypothetical protein